MNNAFFLKTLRESMGKPEAKLSSDGKALTFNGEIANGINGQITFRPSNSTGTSFDAKIDSHTIKHLDKNPKY